MMSDWHSAILAQLATSSVEPIRFVTESHDAGALTSSGASTFRLVLFLLGVGVLCVAAVMWWRLWRGWRTTDSADRAFTAAARRLHLSAPQRRLVACLAEAHGQARPIALLLSEHAYFQAVDRARAQLAPVDSHQTLELESAIFRRLQ